MTAPGRDHPYSGIVGQRAFHARCLVLAQNAGKAEGLGHALSATPESELVAVYDADLRPLPNSLRILASAFGRRESRSRGRFPPSVQHRGHSRCAYGALESWSTS